MYILESIKETLMLEPTQRKFVEDPEHSKYPWEKVNGIPSGIKNIKNAL